MKWLFGLLLTLFVSASVGCDGGAGGTTGDANDPAAVSDDAQLQDESDEGAETAVVDDSESTDMTE